MHEFERSQRGYVRIWREEKEEENYVISISKNKSNNFLKEYSKIKTKNLFKTQWFKT